METKYTQPAKASKIKTSAPSGFKIPTLGENGTIAWFAVLPNHRKLLNDVGLWEVERVLKEAKTLGDLVGLSNRLDAIEREYLDLSEDDRGRLRRVINDNLRGKIASAEKNLRNQESNRKLT